MKIVNIAKDFSKFPIGRNREDGESSGEEFRDSLLFPILLDSDDEILIDMDGTEGYGNSFIEEAFGGLVRKLKKEKMPVERYISRLTFKSVVNPKYKEKALDAINNAKNS